MKILKKIIIVTLDLLFLLFFADILNPYGFTSNVLNGAIAILNVVIACITALATRASAKYQKDSIKELRKKDLSNQATKIYSHMIQHLVKPNSKLFSPYQPVMIGNASNEPIYKVFVVSRSNVDNFHTLNARYKSTLNKSNYKKISNDNIIKKIEHNLKNSKMKNDLKRSVNLPHHLYVYLQIVTPGIIYKLIPYAGSSMGGKRPAAMIFFTDSRGKKWTRDPQGNLILLNDKFDVCKFCNLDATDIKISPSSDMYKTFKSLKDIYKTHKHN